MTESKLIPELEKLNDLVNIDEELHQHLSMKSEKDQRELFESLQTCIHDDLFILSLIMDLDEGQLASV